jgi:hypothetical protein
MPATYQCAACNAKWSEDHEPLDCPQCGSRIIERAGRFGASIEDHYNPPTASVYIRPSVNSMSFSITYWLGYAGFIVGGVLLGVSGDQEIEPLAITGVLVITASAGCLLAAYIISLVKIYRGWDLIQPLRRLDWSESELTTPGMAVGMLFVPFYNLYWNFRAIHGLATKANKYMVISGVKAPPMNEGMAKTYCIMVLCSLIPCLGYLTLLANVVIYYLVVLDIDKMRAAIQDWQESGQKPEFVDDFEAL